jgi:hypothetical protein
MQQPEQTSEVPKYQAAIHAFRGSGIGGSVARLLADRKAERDAEAQATPQG